MARELVPIGSVDLKGETIKDVLFIDIGGSEKMILLFESGRVLLMPVYHKCPVQHGTMQDLKGDLKELTEIIVAEAQGKVSRINELIGEK